jgi:hypothetical protein
MIFDHLLLEQINMKRCLHQIIKPGRKNLESRSGIGECTECEYNPDENEKCKKYTPITIKIYDVED